MTPHESPADLPESIDGLLRRAFVIRTIARCFSCPGSADLDEIRGAAAALTGSASRYGLSAEDAATFVRTWAECDAREAMREQVSLFCGQVRCPPNETAYGDGRRTSGRAFELADIGGFYRAFGFSVARKQVELQDHIAVELEFLSLILLKQAYALVADNAEWFDVSREATATFLETHLGRWVPAFVLECRQHAPSPALDSALGWLLATVAAECRWHEVEPQLASGRCAPEGLGDQLVCPQAAERH